jgi:hypothetical protein
MGNGKEDGGFGGWFERDGGKPQPSDQGGWEKGGGKDGYPDKPGYDDQGGYGEKTPGEWKPGTEPSDAPGVGDKSDTLPDSGNPPPGKG